MLHTLNTKSGSVPLPTFFPDGTYGVVRCVDPRDLAACRVPGLVMNSYHLLSKPGLSVLKAFGGLKPFSGWQGPLITDSGGFQAFSLIRENPKNGEVRKNEIIFRPDGGSKKVILTPEKTIASQFAYGSDIMMCLDYCTHPDDPYEVNEFSVQVTLEWAARCKEEYEKQVRQRRMPQEERPKLFGIIQGGSFPELREKCAKGLIALGFDGYGFGGYPANDQGELVTDILALTASLMPDQLPKYAMGLGKPEGIIRCVEMGYNLFDCVIPTREARHNRLYTFDDPADDDNLNYRHYYILDEEHMREQGPVSPGCDCPTCRHHSRGYLYHLYKLGESLGYRLATMHNLRFYTRLMEKLQAARADG